MHCSRLVSTLLTALVLSLLSVSAASADARVTNDDDGTSAGDVLGVLTDPATLGLVDDVAKTALTSAATEGVTNVASSAAGSLAGSMADGAISLLTEFASWWTSWTVIDLRDAGIDSPLSLALGLSMLIAWLLLIIEAGRAAYTGDGTAIGNALVGLLKTTVVVALLVPFVQGLLLASDALTNWIVDDSFGGMDGLKAKLTSLFTFDPVLGIGLMFVFGLVGILLVLLLMFEFVLRHAGVLIMLCAAPIAAVGMLSRPTSNWWPKAAKGLLTLVLLKPVVAFIFAIAFGILGDSNGVKDLVVGMAALVAAAVAWPVVASYFTFTSIGSGGTVGAALAGGAAGWLGGRAVGGRGPSGSAAAGAQHSMAVERESDADQTGSQISRSSPSGLIRRPSMAGAGSGVAKAGGSSGAVGKGAGAGVSASAGGATAALLAATAAVEAVRGGINSTNAGLTDMARHADLATPYPASPSRAHSGGAPQGRHAHKREYDRVDGPVLSPLPDQPPTAPGPPAISEEQDL